MTTSSFSMDDFDNISNYRVDQTTHGFVAGDVLRTDGANYAKAQADSDSNAEVVGIVSTVIDANAFKLRVIGRQSGLSALVADSVYFLSHLTPGALTLTDPATIGSGFVSKPVLLTDSTTSGVILTYRGINDGGGGDAGPVTLDSISDVDVPSPSDGEILTFNNSSGNWEAAAAAGGGGGAWELVSSSASASAASVDFTGLSDSYSYQIRYSNIRNASSGVLLLQTSTNNGSSYRTTTSYNTSGVQSDGSAGFENQTVRSGIHLSGGLNVSNSDAGCANGIIDILSLNPRCTVRLGFHNGSTTGYMATGQVNVTETPNAIRIIPEAGSFSATSGSIELFRSEKV